VEMSLTLYCQIRNKMNTFKYYKKEIGGTMMFLRIVRVLGDDLVYAQDLEIIPMDYEERFSFGTKHMEEISHETFVDLVAQYSLGALKERPVAGEPSRI